MPIARSLSALLFLIGAAYADHHAAAKADGSASRASAHREGWVDLFNGKDFAGWKAVENPESWRVDEGQMVAYGPRSMLYYVGEVENGDFRDFDWECEVMLKPSANSGMYFHTRVKEDGWPSHGYEAQLNNTHKDRRKTGSIYNVKDLLDESPARDNEWFVQRVAVRGKRVKVYVNGKLVNDYTEPDNFTPSADRQHRRFASGTFALQGHDPGSEIRFRKVRVKVPEPSDTGGR